MSATSRLASANAMALPTPPAPIRATALPEGASNGVTARAKPVVSVLWPVSRPSLTTTVLTAPMLAAPGASASSSGTTASL
ncbi:hypothetical protein ABIA45_006127 [Bradyrhizobium sp. USDA 336]